MRGKKQLLTPKGRRKFVHYDKEKILEELKKYFLLGMSIQKACQTSGLIDDSTISAWSKDITIRRKIESWQNYASAKAREVWVNEITESKNYTAAKEWLERKEKNEFAQRSEVTGADGERQVLTIDIIESLFGKQIRKD